MHDVVKCGECYNIIDETLDGDNRTPCSECGSIKRLYEKKIEFKVKVMTGLKMKHKRPGVKKPLSEIFNGYEMHKKQNVIIKKYRLIDRENDEYRELVTDPISNKVIYDCQEKLSDHVGHGSARQKSNPNSCKMTIEWYYYKHQ